MEIHLLPGHVVEKIVALDTGMQFQTFERNRYRSILNTLILLFFESEMYIYIIIMKISRVIFIPHL